CLADAFARLEVETGYTNVSTLLRSHLARNLGAVSRCVFLDDNRIGAFRNHTAREDSNGLSRIDTPGEGMASRRTTDDVQHDTGLRDVDGSHGVAIHRGHRKGWLVQFGQYVCGEHATGRGANRN